MGKKLKLSTKILIGVVVMSMLSLAIFLVAINTFIRDMLVEQTHDYFDSQNAVMALMVDNWLGEYKNLLYGMSQSLKHIPYENLRDVVNEFAEVHGKISQVWIGLDTDVTITSYAGDLPDDWELFGRPWYYGAFGRDYQVVVGMPFWSITEQIWVTYVSRHVYIGGMWAVASFIITLDTIFEMMNGFAIDEGGYVFLVGTNGNFISHPELLHHYRHDNMRNISEIPQYAGVFSEMLSDGRFIPFVTLGGIYSYILSYQLAFADWLMVSVVPVSLINRSINSVITVVTVTLIAILTGFTALLLNYVSRLIKGSISHTLTEFRQSADTLAKSGNLGRISDWDNSFGLDEISREFGKNLSIFASVMSDLSNFSHEVSANDNVEFRINTERYRGSFKKMILDINEFADRFAATLEKTIEQVQQLEILEANSLAKSNFLANMSHEIRTPMNAILGITEIQLQKYGADNEIKDAFEKIYISGDMLLGIINDILDLSKIEAGKMEIIVEKYETASIINDTIVLNMMRIENKPVEFYVSVDENMPEYMLGDELRIKQILNNILSNAFKYTDTGSVNMAFATEERGENPEDVTLVITVTDTGQGMTTEQLDKLFDSYTRFNVEANRYTEGTGLGMSITGNLINLMDGSIQVESEPGVGSSVTIKLPQRKSGDGLLGKETAFNLSEFRTKSRSQLKRLQLNREPMPYGKVLIVDDVEMNIYVAKGLLAPYSVQTDSAESGFAAIEKVKSGKKYDIIFMDHMMPQMDGIETTKRLREMGYKEPIVALTANAVSGQAEAFLRNGFDEFISKPIDIRQLNMVLNKLVRDKQPEEVLEAARIQSEMPHSGDEGFDDYMKSSGILEMVYKEFSHSQKNIVPDIKKSIEAKDFKNAQLLAHTLKGLAGLIGENNLVTLAGNAEAAFRNRAAPKQCIDELSAEVGRVLARITALTKSI